jgi:hypothetical protein
MVELAELWNKAFAAAQSEFPPIRKSRSADLGNYSYKYADLGDILAAVLPILHHHGLAFAQSPLDLDGRVGVETRIYHSAGHVETFGPFYLPGGNTPQTAGSALTYARRYSACAALGISADEDDDGRAASTQPAWDVGVWAKTATAIFGEWDESRRRKEWVDAIGVALDGRQPSNPTEGAEVLKAMGDVYYAEHPEAGPF